MGTDGWALDCVRLRVAWCLQAKHEADTYTGGFYDDKGAALDWLHTNAPGLEHYYEPAKVLVIDIGDDTFVVSREAVT